MSCQSEKSRRDTLWKKNPLCSICGALTFLPKKVAADLGLDAKDFMRKIPKSVLYSLATLDHLYPRFDPRRYTSKEPARNRLVCWLCNYARGNSDYKAFQKKSKRMVMEEWRNLAHAPKEKKITLGMILEQESKNA